MEKAQSDYHVTWEIDLSAESPEDAARQALEIMRDPESQANVFLVARDGRHEQVVDLSRKPQTKRPNRGTNRKEQPHGDVSVVDARRVGGADSGEHGAHLPRRHRRGGASVGCGGQTRVSVWW